MSAHGARERQLVLVCCALHASDSIKQNRRLNLEFLEFRQVDPFSPCSGFGWRVALVLSQRVGE